MLNIRNYRPRPPKASPFSKFLQEKRLSYTASGGQTANWFQSQPGLIRLKIRLSGPFSVIATKHRFKLFAFVNM